MRCGETNRHLIYSHRDSGELPIIRRKMDKSKSYSENISVAHLFISQVSAIVSAIFASPLS